MYFRTHCWKAQKFHFDRTAHPDATLRPGPNEMASAALVKNIFGSDSDDDSDAEIIAGGVATTTEPEKTTNEGGEDLAAVQPSTSDANETDVVVPRKSSLETYDSDDEDGDDASRRSVPRGPPLHLELPCGEDEKDDSGRGGNARVAVAKLSNIFGVNPRAFDAATHATETVTFIDADGIERMRTSDENVVRWRVNPTSGAVESNARVVEWSDGSRQLFIGDEVLEMTEREAPASDETFLYLRRPGLMQARGRLSSKITFRPATLDSKTHKRLTAAIDKKHGSRATRTMEYVSRVDPEKEKEALDAELEKAARESAALLRKQQKMMKEDRERRYYETGGRAAVDVGYTEAYYERRGGSGDEGEDAAGARMDADFLEAEAEDAAAAEAPFGAPVADQEMNDDDDDEEDDVAAAEPTERKKRRMVDDEEEDE